MIELKEFIGIKVEISKKDSSIVGAMSPTFSIEKNHSYVLQLKVININSNNDLDFIVISDGIIKQYLPVLCVSQFQTSGILKEYKDSTTGYEEKLCYLRFVSEFTSNNVRLTIGRRFQSLDKIGDIAFYFRQVKLSKGTLLSDWSEKPNETPLSIINYQSQFLQEAHFIKSTVQSIENDTILNKSQIEQLDNSITLAVSTANKAQEDVTNATGEIQILAGQINNKVTSGEVMSLIQQNPTDVQFYFNKISPSVTISANGLTVHQGRIACDALATPEGHQPIIKIFPNGSGYCSIDATSKYESGGFGGAIRLKLDSSNYVYVGNKSIAFYLSGSSNDNHSLCSFRGSDNYFEMATKGGILKMDGTNVSFNGKNLAFQGSAFSVSEVSAQSTSNNELIALEKQMIQQQLEINLLKETIEMLSKQIDLIKEEI